MLFLAETKCSVDSVTTKCRRFDFQNFVGMDAQGRSGGTCLGWCEGISCEVISMSQFWINAICRIPGHNDFLLTCVYGPPKLEDRHLL